MKRMRLALLGLAAVAVAASGTALAKSAATPQKITIGATEYAFAMSKKTVKKGTVTFTLLNKGDEPHDFKVQGKTPKSRILAGGQRQTFSIKFPKAGRYQYVCTIGEHALKGMQGVLIVK